MFTKLLVGFIFLALNVLAETPKTSPSPQKSPPNQSGFLIKKIRKGSVYEKLGFKKGDILQTYNGKSVMDPLAASELEEMLKKDQQVEIEILRDGNKIKNTYQIK